MMRRYSGSLPYVHRCPGCASSAVRIRQRTMDYACFNCKRVFPPEDVLRDGAIPRTSFQQKEWA